MSERPEAAHGAPPAALDLRERGLPVEGVPQRLDRRLFVQLFVFRATGAKAAERAIDALAAELERDGIAGVVYADMNDPHGVGLLTFDENPVHFVDRVRPIFAREPLSDLTFRPELAMIGRTYSSGYENDLEYWLLRRPVETVMHEGWNWAIWYPLRRTGAFNRLSREEQAGILREHGTIGRSYGEQDLAHDVRLACHGLDASDNEFLIGLVGKELYPLSHVVQTMRGTRQTAEYMQQMGPFFVGRAVRRVKARVL
jgi:hypothetical protein